MSAKLLKGESIATEIRKEVEKEIKKLSKFDVTPSLAAIQVGDDPASKSYIRRQKKSCEKVGLKYKLHQLDSDTNESKLIDYIQNLNEDDSVNGIILQMPLPKSIDATKAQITISDKKDVEGVTPTSLGLIVFDQPRLVPCTAMSVIKLLESVGEEIRGKEAVVVGRSTIVGKPVALLLLQRKYSPTTTVCHTGTRDRGMLEEHVGNAEILVVAAGQPEFIKGEWIKEGAIVLDAGINFVEGKLVGDVEFETAKEKASYITPVPGGVGPITVAMLMNNTVEATKWQLH